MNKLEMKTTNIVNENIKYIQDRFPNAIVETEKGFEVDFNTLKQEMSNIIADDTKEKYQLTWPGKKEAILLANTRTTKTLRPIREKSVDFDNTENIYIEGDNLEALKILQESYLNKIKCIYIDPPYNTGNDFIYNDNFKKNTNEELEDSGQVDDEGNRLVTNTESNGRFHSVWLNMMYSRLKLARNLLTEDGVIFISIDDNEQANLKKICDDIFGETNFVGQLIHQRAKGGGQAKYIVKGHDYILVYSKCLSSTFSLKRKKVIQQKTIEKDGKLYIIDDDVLRKSFGKYDKTLNDRRCFYEEISEYKGKSKKLEIDEKISKGEYFLVENKFGLHTICKYVPVDNAYSKMYSIITIMSEEGKNELDRINLPYFDYPKPINLIIELVHSAVFDDEKAIILDFFSGSATTANAVININATYDKKLKYIMVQVPEKCNENSEAYKDGFETICDIGEERIRRAGKKIKEETNANIDYGFRVYKIDSSNMKDVYYKPNDLEQAQLNLFETNVKEDRTNEDLLTQIILDLGLTLDLKIEEKNISSNKVYYVAENSLVACFDKNIDINIIDEICKCKPLKIVFKEECFNTDNLKINVQEKIKKLSPESEVYVL